jgi:hypothetical protein
VGRGLGGVQAGVWPGLGGVQSGAWCGVVRHVDERVIL